MPEQEPNSIRERRPAICCRWIMWKCGWVASLAASIACASAPASQPSEAPRVVLDSIADVHNDTFDSTYRVDGPLRVPRSTLDERLGFFLQSRVNKYTGASSHVLVGVHVYHGDWLFWERGSLDTQAPLTFVESRREVGQCGAERGGGCRLTETFGLVVPENLLRSRSDGFSVKVYARSGAEFVLDVEPLLVVEHLRVVDSLTAVVRRR
jgi:hypothetical protein